MDKRSIKLELEKKGKKPKNGVLMATAAHQATVVVVVVLVPAVTRRGPA
jgi:hypothetical protein